MPSVDSSRCYLGIDPGASGGLAVISSDGSYGATSMPPTLTDVWKWFQEVVGFPSDLFTVIEKVGGYVGGSGGNIGSAMFRFGESSGALKAFLIAAGIPYEEVTPGVWQKGVGVTCRKKTESKTQWKNRLKSRAQALYPSLQVTLATADALLIATYCQRKREGTL